MPENRNQESRIRNQETGHRTYTNTKQTMKTMKAYIQPETVDVRLLPDALMQHVANPSDNFEHVSGMGEDSGLTGFDAPGNKRRQL